MEKKNTNQDEVKSINFGNNETTDYINNSILVLNLLNDSIECRPANIKLLEKGYSFDALNNLELQKSTLFLVRRFIDDSIAFIDENIQRINTTLG